MSDYWLICVGWPVAAVFAALWFGRTARAGTRHLDEPTPYDCGWASLRPEEGFVPPAPPPAPPDARPLITEGQLREVQLREVERAADVLIAEARRLALALAEWLAEAKAVAPLPIVSQSDAVTLAGLGAIQARAERVRADTDADTMRNDCDGEDRRRFLAGDILRLCRLVRALAIPPASVDATPLYVNGVQADTLALRNIGPGPGADDYGRAGGELADIRAAGNALDEAVQR